MEKIIDDLSWLLTLSSLLGGQLVINKNKKGYVIWIVVNFLWVSYYIYKGLYSSTILFLVYLVQSYYGYKKWNTNSNTQKDSQYN